MARGRKKEAALSPAERLQAALVPEREQPYQVPENWCWCFLGKLVLIRRGASPRPIKSYVTANEDGVNWIKIGDADGDKYITHVNEKITEIGAKKSVFVEKGTLLLSNSMSFGHPYILKVNGCIHDGWLALTPSKTTEKEYLYYALLSSEWYFQQVAVGTAVRNLNSERVAGTPIPIPPLSEQHRIVERIENLFAKLDEAKQKAQDALDSFETRKAAILHKAFTGELTAQWRKKQHISRNTWKVLTLDDVAEYKKGPFGSSITKAMFVPKGDNTYKVYEQGNAIRKTVNYGHYYISEQKYLELKGFSISAGDIIISCAGTIGEVFRLPANCEPGVINQALMRVRIFSNIKERYFIYYFGGVLKGSVVDQANGTAIKNIPPFKIMKAMKIDLPSLPEQAEIVRNLDDLLAKEQQAEEAAEKVLEQIDMTKKAILARAFRGELGTNDPSEESAVELLKQVL